MNELWWHKLSRDTLALILANEFLLEHQTLPDLKLLLEMFAPNQLDRVALLELMMHKSKLMGMSSGQMISLHTGLSPDPSITASVLETQPVHPVHPSQNTPTSLQSLKAVGSDSAGAASAPAASATAGTNPFSVNRPASAPAAGTQNPAASQDGGSSSAGEGGGAFRVKMPASGGGQSGGRVPKIEPVQSPVVIKNPFPEPQAASDLISGKGKGAAPAVGASAGILGSSVKTMSQKRVLLADDDRRIRMIFRKKLADAHYIVDEAATGEEAWDLLQENPYGALIMDMKMPGLHGLELLSRLSAEGGKMPVVVCSAYDQLKDDFVVATYPKLKFFVKPVSPNAIVEAIEEFLPITR